MSHVAIVTFDKESGLTITGTGLVIAFHNMKDAFQYASEINRIPGIENIEIQRIDTSR
tara:strand:+ start:96 stop:269 length:174 start_codon:yes stop_codon:yes gene_type:complete